MPRGLRDELSGPRLDDLVPDLRAHAPGEHKRVLVLVLVHVRRRRQRARGMVCSIEGEAAVRLLAAQDVAVAKTGKVGALSIGGFDLVWADGLHRDLL